MADQLVHCFTFLLTKLAKDIIQIGDSGSDAYRSVTGEVKHLMELYQDPELDSDSVASAAEGADFMTGVPGITSELMVHPPLTIELRNTIKQFYDESKRAKFSDKLAVAPESLLAKPMSSREESSRSNRAGNIQDLPLPANAPLSYDDDAFAKKGVDKNKIVALIPEESIIYTPPSWVLPCYDILKKISKHEFIDLSSRSQRAGSFVLNFMSPVVELYPSIAASYLAVIKYDYINYF